MRPFVIWCLLVIIGVAFLAWQAARVAELEVSGVRIEGQVVRMQERRNGSINHSNYHAIVRFRTQDNRTIEFEDFSGEPLPIFPSSPQSGKAVTVLYLANDPSGHAIIDRGPFWNWVRVALNPFDYFR